MNRKEAVKYYNEGRRAHGNDLDCTFNPYIGTLGINSQYALWMRGWTDATLGFYPEEIGLEKKMIETLEIPANPGYATAFAQGAKEFSTIGDGATNPYDEVDQPDSWNAWEDGWAAAEEEYWETNHAERQIIADAEEME